MSSIEKGNLIGLIVQQLKLSSMSKGDTQFCEGDTFFALAFKSDKDIKDIAKLAGL